ncbi:MAG: MarC family protein [Candidatus Thermoplasmatota archaeon]|nr:MarC family protein [Candidatus Thermoplasmatota archaeon]
MIEDVISPLIQLIIIVDPLTTLALFLSLTPGTNRKERRDTIRKATIASILLLICFGLGGNLLLEYMGITLESLMIAGGLLLAIIGIDMLLHGIQLGGGRSLDGNRSSKPVKREDIAIVPLALPSIAGPGAITLVMVLTNRMPWYMLVIMVTIAVLVCTLVLCFAEFIYGVLGEEGNKALTRIMGLLTVAFAVQYILDGISGWMASLL